MSNGRLDSFGTPAGTSLRVLLISLLGYYGLFELPFQFPLRHRLTSPSYAFGFNNAIAILAFVALLGIVTLFIISRRGTCEPPIRFQVERSILEQRSAIIELAFVALLYAALTFAMYLYNSQSAPWLMWETRHFLYRAYLMNVYGLRPYTEFQAEYGPLLTYTPLYMYLLLEPLGASLDQAYFACHLLLNLVGLWCAYYVLSRVMMPSGARLITFAVITLSGFAPYMGLNGVLLRYLCPFACLLLGHRAVMRTLSYPRPRSALCWLGLGVTVLLLFSANVLLSPEIAVSFVLAWLGYAALTARCGGGALAVSFVALIAAGVLCWVLLPAEYYESLLRFSEGANNLPLLPAAHLLFYVLTVFIIVPPLLATSIKEPSTRDVHTAAICGALGILCTAMAPGALGRCDPPHVLFYGMGASMLLMIRLANISRPIAFRAYVVIYGCVFLVLIQVTNLNVFYGVSPRSLLSHDVVTHLATAFRLGSGTNRPDPAKLAVLDRYPRLGLPFATFADPAVEMHVLSRGQLDPEYYISILGVYTAAALERKLRDVAKSEYLLVPRDLEVSSTSKNLCDEYLRDLRQWFLYPAKLPCRAQSLDPVAAVAQFIADHYMVVENFDSWLVLRRVSIPAE